MGLAVSGGLNDNTVVAFGPVDGESKMLSGGEFGIEGTVGSTAVWGVASVVVLLILRRTTRTRRAPAVGAAVEA